MRSRLPVRWARSRMPFDQSGVRHGISRDSKDTSMLGIRPAFSVLAQLPPGGTTMPVQIRKLGADEAARVFPKRGQMDLSEYADALRELKPGDAAEIDLGNLSSRAL